MTGIGAAMAGGNPRIGRQGQDWYPTPNAVTTALLDVWEPVSATVWEPACGDGVMARVIQDAGYDVIATDLIDRGHGTGGVDFLSTKKRAADCLVTNPPFDLAGQFIRHAFALGVKEMALVLKSTYWHAKGRKHLYDDHTPSLVMPLLWRPDFLGLGRPTMEVMWCVWDSRPGPRPIYLPLDRPAVKQGRLL